MQHSWFKWAPLPLRIAVGAYLVWNGYTLFSNLAAAVTALTDLGIPTASLVIYGVAGIALLGGLAILLGAFIRYAAWLVTFSVGAHLLFAFVLGGFPASNNLASGATLIPGVVSSILILVAMGALQVSGAGLLSIDAAIGRYNEDVKYNKVALTYWLRVIPGWYLAILGAQILLIATRRDAAIAVLQNIGIPMAEIVWFGVALIGLLAGLFLAIGFFPRFMAILQIFSVGAHAAFAFAGGNGSALTFPLPTLEQSVLILGFMFSVVIAEFGVTGERLKNKMSLLNLMAPIKRGEEEKLRAVLDEIGADLSGNRYIQFPNSEKTHFARFFITRHPEGPRLGMGATYNGSLEDYCKELLRIAPGIEEVWGRCEGWTGREGFYEFAKKNDYPSGMVFFGFPDSNVKEIRAQMELRERINEILASDGSHIGRLVTLIDQVKKPMPFMYWFAKRFGKWRFETAEAIRHAVLPQIQETARAIGSIDIVPDWSRLTTNLGTDGSPASIAKAKQELANILDLENHENSYAQTTMTVVADIKPGRTWILRSLFAVAPPLLDYAWSRGNFAGVYSLHSFRFAIIDGGKRVWFMSNYNGSAENYFSDFIDKLNWGINSAYTHCTDYPDGGMGQQDAFAYWIRVRQLPSLVYYSAYPTEGIHKIITNREIAALVGTNFDKDDAEKLLALL
ncbi:MAG: DoxX family membrane protein [Phototrophicaceae bacterium]